MADSKTKQITDAFVALLGANDKPAGVTVDKSRRTPVSIDVMPKYSVYRVHRRNEPAGNPRNPALLKRTMTIEVKAWIAGDDDASDVHEQFIISKIVSDRVLGGTATNVDEVDCQYTGEEGTDEITVVIQQFEVEYITSPSGL